MYAASGRKTEYRRRRARRASALMVVLALLFTMVPTGFATVAGAAEATETEPPAAPPEPTPEPIPEPTPEPPADDTTDDPADDPADDPTDDPADDITDRAAPTATAVTVTCYAAVDGGWKPVGTVQTDKIDSGRYYVTAQELDGIYGEYGFSSANYSGERFFPHTDDNSIDKLWADAVPQQNTDGAWQIPLSTRGPIYLYYLPGNTAGSPGYFDSSKSKTDAEMLAANMFYTVQVEDPTHAVYDTPPAPQVLFHGEGTTVTLNKAEGVTWTAVNGQTGATLSLAMDEAGTTYTITDISTPIIFRPRAAAGMIQYEAMPERWMSKLGNFDVSRQQPQQTATVKGEKVYMALPAENSHALLPPDIDRIAVTITDANNHTMFYSFAGWKVASVAGSPVLPAGTVLTAEDLNRYAGSDGVIRLQAVWSGVDSQRRPNTVHFFLHKNGELKGSVEDGVKPESPDDYTPAIYSTRMMNAGEIPTTYTTGGTPLVARPSADADAYQTNTTIRDMVRTPVKGATLEDLPGDETVFAYLRANNIQMQINGQVVENEKLNTTYFGIRWNTVKYESSDGWHIDGVLVAKRSRFIVTKTFAGDTAAIDLAKKDFTITVSHTEGSGSVTDFTLLPQPAAGVTEAGKRGYTDYDAATQTYTWEVPAQQKRSYTITEAGYIPSGSWRVSNSYAIRNAPEGGPTGYQPYPKDGIVITAVGYADDVQNIAVQTVALRNIYVGVGTLTVNTQDAITGDNLRDITYRLTRADGSAVTLYRRPGTTLYSMEKDDPGYTETIPDGTLIAGANGLFTIRLETGTYTLTETLPTGYYGPGTVQVTVAKEASGGMTYRSVAQNLPTEVTTPTGGWLKDADTDHITILNVPRMLISVMARSSWPENGEKLPVTVQLWCDGTPVPGDQYTQVLSEENKWEYTWNNLPLFTNGTVAGYTLRVTKIGNTYRDAALDDGFADYNVTNDAVKYRKTGDPDYRADHMWEEDGVQHFAQEALLVVRNEGVRGAVTFTKADEMNRPLQGAEFTLYTDELCTKTLATATSNEDGEVRFTPQPGGTYYLKETKAPNGHTAENTVWTVKIAGGKATITDPKGAVITSVRNTSLLQLTLRVLGPDGESLPGTKLQVKWNTAQYPEYTTDTDGTVVLPKLPNGNYTVRLMNTPTGYLPPVSVPELNAQYGEITLTSGDDAWTLENTAEGYLLTLRLQALYTLPTTGGTGTAAFTAAGVLLMGLAAVMLCRKKQVE